MTSLDHIHSVLNQVQVLIVEDDDALRLLYKQVFEREGCGVSVAIDGAAALSLVARERPQLVLLDIGIPLVSGLEVLQSIRRQPALEHVKVIVLSGSEFADDSLEARTADAHLVKPVSIAQLVLVAYQVLSGANPTVSSFG